MATRRTDYLHLGSNTFLPRQQEYFPTFKLIAVLFARRVAAFERIQTKIDQIYPQDEVVVVFDLYIVRSMAALVCKAKITRGHRYSIEHCPWLYSMTIIASFVIMTLTYTIEV